MKTFLLIFALLFAPGFALAASNYTWATSPSSINFSTRSLDCWVVGQTMADFINDSKFYQSGSSWGNSATSMKAVLSAVSGNPTGLGGTCAFTIRAYQNNNGTMTNALTSYTATVIAATPDSLTDYQTAMSQLPQQDILYALGVAVCALLGIGVGAKLL